MAAYAMICPANRTPCPPKPATMISFCMLPPCHCERSLRSNLLLLENRVEKFYQINRRLLRRYAPRNDIKSSPVQYPPPLCNHQVGRQVPYAALQTSMTQLASCPSWWDMSKAVPPTRSRVRVPGF